jgi:hypothetical protein
MNRPQASPRERIHVNKYMFYSRYKPEQPCHKGHIPSESNHNLKPITKDQHPQETKNAHEFVYAIVVLTNW